VPHGYFPSVSEFALPGLTPSVSTPPRKVDGRKRGRPRAAKDVVLGPKRPRGRPRKYPQELGEDGQPRLPVKRRVGRPSRVQNAGGVLIDFGKHTISGTQSCPPITRHSSLLPPTNPISGTQSCSPTRQSSFLAANSGQPGERTQNGHTPHLLPPLPSRALPSHALAVSPGNVPTRRIIPSEDPERLVEIDEDEDEACGDGIGNEDEDLGDEPGDMGSPAGGEDSSGSLMASSNRKHHLLPPWLLVEFNLVKKELENPNGTPSLYSQDQTFWRRRPSPYFILQRNAILPSDLYDLDFFIWDPKSHYKVLACPDCGHTLHRHGIISCPRRVVDIRSSFWLIGFRYRCPQCRNVTSNKCTKTWKSWDPRIIASLPLPLAAEFPAHLTHRAGISKSLFSWMRSCLQSGMGSKQFADALLVQHLLRYDELHLQYVDCLVSRKGLAQWRGQKYKSFLPFDNTSDDGLHGYVPSAQWLRDIYDNYIEEHRDELNQHMAMLTAEICAIDHSHKITKHVAKVNGECIFCGLLTVTNQKGEIRSSNLVATKAHSQFCLALNRMRESLQLYGHRQPELFYTDNMADKGFLESSFPSLLENVVPVQKYANLGPRSCVFGCSTNSYSTITCTA